MNYSRVDGGKLSQLHNVAEREFRDAGFKSPRRAFSDRGRARRQRDLVRGYSINVKQVVLAFAVEFWIIGLIIIGTYLLVAESGDRGHVSRVEVFSALLLPAALSMVELARVPLAIAVRTQTAWHIKFFATLGVIAAITVTSFSLSQIAWKTFDIRIAEATAASEKVAEVKARNADIQTEIVQSQRVLVQRISDRNAVSDRLAALQKQLTQIATSAGENCKPVLGQDGKPVVGADGNSLKDCHHTIAMNQTQFNALKGQIASTQKDLDVAQVAVKQAEDNLNGIDPRQVEQELANAETEYRSAVNKSQLYSYAGMMTGKAGTDVTEADVKRLEKYLILIFSIAAAFASTLLAVTAVRRLKPPDPQPVSAIPDEAAKYLFGPLIEAIKTEARLSVATAMNEKAKTTVPPNHTTV